MARRIIRRLGAAAAMLAAAAPHAQAAQTVTSIVETFANAAMQGGSVEGLEIAVVIGSAKPVFYSFGVADAATQAKPTPNTVFQIASVTKVFTTNLLGQAVNANTLALSDPLSSFAAQLGSLPANTAQVTLQDLADFTGGFPSLAGFCGAGQKSAKTGCLPGGNNRPTVTQYSAADFAAFFRTYATAGAPPLGYFYSDFSLGLVGLLLGAEPGAALTNKALTGWDTLLRKQLLQPLKMTSTFLDVPAGATSRQAYGYQPAQAMAYISGGTVNTLDLVTGGSGYTSAPAVAISGGGGGGAGAQATAQVSGGFVTGFTVTRPGTGYTAPATVAFSSGSATGSAIIKNGHVIGVSLRANGGYTSVPTVTFSGGRVGGRDAKGTVFVDHDEVTYIKISDPGAGYVDPIAVSVAPGAPTALAVPIWAPAGALKSTAKDLATFAAAALGQASIGTIKVPKAITAGFTLAETPYACEQGSPGLAGCTAPKSGLAWDITTATPETVVKDGGLPGFSSVVILLPAQNAAVVVLGNSFEVTGPAPLLGAEIIAALYHEGLVPARR